MAAFVGDPQPVQGATPPGDSSSGPGKRNAYRFLASGGEAVTLTLSRDGAKGSEGEIAQLDLRQEGGAIVETRKGAMPIEFTATLPQVGSYNVEVIKVPLSATDGSPFRGYYNLDAVASSGPELTLQPILE